MKTSTLTTRRRLTKARVRAHVNGTAARPRLSVRITNANVIAQLVDDEKSQTLAYASSVGQKSLAKKTMTDKAEWAGSEISKQAKAAKIGTAVFDRGWRTYHGRVKKLAEAARAGGLKF